MLKYEIGSQQHWSMSKGFWLHALWHGVGEDWNIRPIGVQGGNKGYVHIEYQCMLPNSKLNIVNIILRQDPEVCPDSQRVSGHDDDDDDGDDNPYAPHKQHVLNPYWRSSVNVEV